jgi:hypothetical protein
MDVLGGVVTFWLHETKKGESPEGAIPQKPLK